MNKIITGLALMTAVVLLSGCNTVKGTVHGMGQDITSVTGTSKNGQQKTTTTTTRYTTTKNTNSN